MEIHGGIYRPTSTDQVNREKNICTTEKSTTDSQETAIETKSKTGSSCIFDAKAHDAFYDNMAMMGMPSNIKQLLASNKKIAYNDTDNINKSPKSIINQAMT